ncbi:MAG: BMP family ABC transporter substrate-binding protein [Rhodobacteraceae bacterium GWE1_64_9]|nr:MAG: BMP family ABC transporter substrate-binding protein [Rhodobacteraceae bacterium GWE1_64_9]OHC51396.1 MAG: BMP family ABC transporter substrate-binding protein [Rhodobacteraceae bacterium GWF1_65_7]HBD89546.1 BMP family ABC transporter substrate-binding protein [Gemmobacter sp.]
MTKAILSPTRRGLLLGSAAAALGLALPRRVMAQETIKIAGIYTVPVEQQWVSRIHIAAEAAKAAGGVEYTYTENVANTDYPRVMREYCESGVTLIVGEIFGAEAEAREVAAEYPDVKFLMGSSFLPDAGANPNLAVFDNYIQDASYLSGIIAGAMTKTGSIGMVGGFPIPEVNRLMNAFMAGVKETRPDATFQVSFIGSWFDPPKAKETAFAMIEGGVDLLYAERFGVSDAAKEKGVLAIGNVIDTQADYPETVVASALWHFEPTLTAALEAIRAGSFVADNYGTYSFMKAGGCSLAPLGTFDGKVPEAALALVAEKEAAIKAGTFTVEINDGEPKSS